MTHQLMDPEQAKDVYDRYPHEGTCADTLCPACGCCTHCATDPDDSSKCLSCTGCTDPNCQCATG